jgi:hypothetical protein
MHFNVPKALRTIEFARSSRVNLWSQVFSHIVELIKSSGTMRFFFGVGRRKSSMVGGLLLVELNVLNLLVH